MICLPKSNFLWGQKMEIKLQTFFFCDFIFLDISFSRKWEDIDFSSVTDKLITELSSIEKGEDLKFKTTLAASFLYKFSLQMNKSLKVISVQFIPNKKHKNFKSEVSYLEIIIFPGIQTKPKA